MAHEVFICYASSDKAVAEAVCDALESRGVKCWIAPRDVLPGMEWAETIVDAIDSSRALILVLSKDSNISPQVIREVGRAAGKGIPIIPLLIDDVSPSKAMDYFISRHHWLDAQTGVQERHIKRLTDTVQQILAREGAPPKGEEKVEAEEKAKQEEEEARKAREAEEKAKREAEEAKKTEKAKERERKEAREEAKAKGKARREVEEKPIPVKKPVAVKQKLVKRKWFWAAVSVLVVVGIIIPTALLSDQEPSAQAPPTTPVAATYALTVNLQGQGTVVLSPSGGSYSSGTQVTLTANPGSGWEFSHWGGGLTGSQNPATIIVNSDTNITGTFVEQTIVTFLDANLEAAIRSAIGKPTGDITTTDLEDLTSLSAIDKGISNLTGMQYCTSLNNLDLGQNQISNISPLSSLVNLTHLDLAVNEITDISPLASLTNLTRLTLSLNWFIDASPLASLTNLTTLWLTNCSIYDATPLASLTNLTGISLHMNYITDVSFAASLTKLELLYLGYNEISDISPLLENSGLGAGDTVDLAKNPLSQTSINTYIPQLQARGVEVQLSY